MRSFARPWSVAGPQFFGLCVDPGKSDGMDAGRESVAQVQVVATFATSPRAREEEPAVIHRPWIGVIGIRPGQTVPAPPCSLSTSSNRSGRFGSRPCTSGATVRITCSAGNMGWGYSKVAFRSAKGPAFAERKPLDTDLQKKGLELATHSHFWTSVWAVECDGDGQHSRIRNAKVRLSRFLGCHNIMTE